MNQPKYEDYMLPEILLLKDGESHLRNALIEEASKQLGVTEKMKLEVTSSGQLLYSERAGWGLVYLKEAGLITSPKRGYFSLTPLGKKYLGSNPKRMSKEDLKQFPDFIKFINRHNEKIEQEVSGKKSKGVPSSLSPDEAIAAAVKEQKAVVCGELLDQIKTLSPSAFESLVIKVLLAMGYGDNDDSGLRIGGAGDGGVDGVIKEDKLGLDTIYIQAKRYQETNLVSPHDVRDFVGALSGRESKGSRKGIFITTSDFTKEGKEYIDGIKDAKVILINGDEFAGLMYDYGIGVSDYATYTLKKLDNDFFD